MTDGTPRSPLQNFVNGKFVDTSDGRTSDVIDPSTGEVYAQAPVSGRQDVDAAMQAARPVAVAGTPAAGTRAAVTTASGPVS